MTNKNFMAQRVSTPIGVLLSGALAAGAASAWLSIQASHVPDANESRDIHQTGERQAAPACDHREPKPALNTFR